MSEKRYKKWTQADDYYLRTHYPDSSTKDMAISMARTEQQIQQRACELGVRKSKAAKGRSTDKWRILDEVVTLMYADMHNDELADFLGVTRADIVTRACKLRLKKSPQVMAEVNARRIMALAKNTAHRFQKGLTPWNKGMRGFDPALGRGLFKPGTVPSYMVPVGTERLRQSGVKGQELWYLVRKIAEPNVWERVHRLVWEQANGPIPPGHYVVFKPGKKSVIASEITPDKLECISGTEHARRNHPQSKSPEYSRLVQLKSAISRQVKRIAKQHEQPEYQ